MLLLDVIANHLKSRLQLWRMLASGVIMGVVVGSYAVLQHSGHDFRHLAEQTGGRTSVFMGNAIFAGATLTDNNLFLSIPIEAS